MKLTLETKRTPIAEPVMPAGISITPPIDEDFWIFRVKVSDDQAIVGFPKFGLIGIGFAKEKDWNTNLPSSCDAEYIYNHIKHNKGDKRITRSTCIKAIMMIQQAALNAVAQD